AVFTFQVCFCSSLIGIYTRQSLRSIVILCKSGDNTVEMPIKRCPLGSPECALFIVAQLLLRLLGGKPSAATKTHSGEQKSNSKGKQARNI
ncbi:hypothetical protein, partial [Pseudoalteromonas piscicida]|uniref:hypothetical protein n=1 Tax=Pseudoalteromonas piscicida TaxID=43662 RepID=UPI001BB16523